MDCNISISTTPDQVGLGHHPLLEEDGVQDKVQRQESSPQGNQAANGRSAMPLPLPGQLCVEADSVLAVIPQDVLGYSGDCFPFAGPAHVLELIELCRRTKKNIGL